MGLASAKAMAQLACHVRLGEGRVKSFASLKTTRHCKILGLGFANACPHQGFYVVEPGGFEPLPVGRQVRPSVYLPRCARQRSELVEPGGLEVRQ